MPRGPKPGVERGAYSRISLEAKERLIQAVEDGQDYVSVARTLSINVATARSILLRHEDGDSLEDGRGGRRPECVKLTSPVTERIVQLVEQQPDITLKSIQQRLSSAEPPEAVQLSVTSIARALDGKLITSKKLEDCPAQRNSPRVKAARANHAEWYLANMNLGVHICIDETSFNLFTRRTRGRAERGQPAYRQLRFERGKNLNLVMAVSATAGVVYFELHDTTLTKLGFQHFLDKRNASESLWYLLLFTTIYRWRISGEMIVFYITSHLEEYLQFLGQFGDRAPSFGLR